MKSPIFTGSCVAIVTPFYPDGTVNFVKLGELIEFQIAGGTAAITICGTTGESSTLNDTEHRKCIEYCVQKAAGRVKVIAGTGSNDTAYAVELSVSAAKDGVDALLMVTPYYNKCTQKGLIKHYLTVAEAAGKPIILYNVPSRTGMSITADTYCQLSKHPLINGVKEASGNLSLIGDTLYRCGDDFNIWSGNDSDVLPILAMGGKGVISVVSNVAPRIMSDICSLFFVGKINECAALCTKYYPLCSDLFIEVNPIPVKTAMNMMGMDVGGLRMPLCEMSDNNAAVLRSTLIKSGLLRA